jgi:centromeric protein E
VDLAGSEGVRQTKAQGMRKKEGANINKSLLALSQVIRKLSRQEKNVVFRESKLTRMLSPSLGGNSKTIVICNINP